MNHSLILSLVTLLFCSSFSLGQNPERRFGWRSSPHGIAGSPIASHPKFKAAPLPASASIAKWFRRTNQGDRGACVMFSALESVDAVHQKDFHGQHIWLSYLDGYQRCLLYDGSFPNDWGTYGGTALKVLSAGILTEKTWPYSKPLNQLPPNTPKIDKERARHLVLKSYALPNDDNGYAIKQCVANLKIAPIIGSYWYGNEMNAKLVNCVTKDANGKAVTVERYVMAYPQGRYVGGHEVAITAYDDNMVFPNGDVGGCEFHNHWEGFGDKRGSAWASYRRIFNPGFVEDVHAIEIYGTKKP